VQNGRRGKIDTGTDFITPEFLNILFFQQKNVVIFPYVDLKHLHTLEIFTAGHSIVDLESTALHDLKGLLEFESTNTYSQLPSLYFIYNLDKTKVEEVMSLENIRCVLNASENVSELVNGSNFVFFNKKSNHFLNLDETDLAFEEHLITSSGNKEVLQDTIQKIKVISSRIFAELNQNGTLDNLPQLLKEFDAKYWKKILDFTGSYFDIKIPDVSHLPSPDRKESPDKTLQDFSDEYTILVSTNKAIGKEFIQLLHDYRSKKVNSSHLVLEQLFNPVELYNYLRNHHWKDGVPESFMDEWIKMNMSGYQLTESDQADFEMIIKRLGLTTSAQESVPSITPLPALKEPDLSIIPSPSADWIKYKGWIEDRLTELARLTSDIPRSSEAYLYLVQEFSEISTLLEKIKGTTILKAKKITTQMIPEPIKQELDIRLTKLRIKELVGLCDIDSKVEFVIDFISYLSNLHDDEYGKKNSEKIDNPLKIKRLGFPSKLENEILIFNRIRNKVAHRNIPREERNKKLDQYWNRLKTVHLHLLAHLLHSQTQSIARKYNFSKISVLNQFLITNYINDTAYSQQEITEIQKFMN